MTQLSPDDIQRLEAKKVANIIRKIGAGKTTTAREDAILAQYKVGAPATAESGFVKTWGELATALGTSLRAIKNWRNDPRYKADCPVARDDGRHDVAAWGAFMVKYGLAGADEEVDAMGNLPTDGEDAGEAPVVQAPRIAGTQVEWKIANLAKEYQRREIELGKTCNSLLVAADLEIPLGAVFVAIQSKLTQFPERAGPQVAGFDDVQEVIGILREEVDADLSGLHGAEYLADLDAQLADLPTDPETERLLRLVSFAGQDRAALLQLIRHVAGLVLRGIGRRVIASAVGAPTEILHEVTGQVSSTAEESHASSRNETTEPKEPSTATPPKRPAQTRAGPRRGKRRKAVLTDPETPELLAQKVRRNRARRK